ncbi:MAG TPA: hypothetical protein VK487_02210 [Candidatus Bathyarchaeia archaeon]|nr:hypothetical protein [Candidatus Bathyarchaeia archaeon]
MVSCVQCGRPIGLLEYTLGDSNLLGLCKNCRKAQKQCDNCLYMFIISMENSPIVRCIKYGYNLTDKKSWAKAANCQYYTPKIPTDSRKPQNTNRARTASKANKTVIARAGKEKSKRWF